MCADSLEVGAAHDVGHLGGLARGGHHGQLGGQQLGPPHQGALRALSGDCARHLQPQRQLRMGNYRHRRGALSRALCLREHAAANQALLSLRHCDRRTQAVKCVSDTIGTHTSAALLVPHAKVAELTTRKFSYHILSICMTEQAKTARRWQSDTSCTEQRDYKSSPMLEATRLLRKPGHFLGERQRYSTSDG